MTTTIVADPPRRPELNEQRRRERAEAAYQIDRYLAPVVHNLVANIIRAQDQRAAALGATRRAADSLRAGDDIVDTNGRRLLILGVQVDGVRCDITTDSPSRTGRPLRVLAHTMFWTIRRSHRIEMRPDLHPPT